ncbi:MAG: hypothetical protein PVH29_08245 [Candidatus Zixiibacteriota bacterium]|jgi:hypothetical protein
MAADVWAGIIALVEAGDAAAAVERCLAFWEREGGPAERPEGDDDPIRALNSLLTVWQQIELYVGEVNRRSANPRTWKLLAYAYMWAGAYVPALLRAAEQALLASAAREEDEGRAANIDEKMELCRRALAGEKEARAELIAGEEAFAAKFTDFPARVPMPELFVRSGAARQAELTITAAVIAPDLLDILND